MKTDAIVRPLAVTQEALQHASSLVADLTSASRAVVDGTRSGPNAQDVALAEQISHAAAGLADLKAVSGHLPSGAASRRGAELIGAEIDGAIKWTAAAQEEAGSGPRPWLLKGDDAPFMPGAEPPQYFDRSTIAHYASVERALTVADSHLGSVDRLLKPGGLGALLQDTADVGGELKALLNGDSKDVGNTVTRLTSMRTAITNELGLELKKLTPQLDGGLKNATSLTAERGALLKELRNSPSASTHARFAQVDAELLRLHETPGMWRVIHLNNAATSVDALVDTLTDTRVRHALEAGDIPATGAARSRIMSLESPMRVAASYLELAMRDRPHDQGSTVSRLVPVSTLQRLAAR